MSMSRNVTYSSAPRNRDADNLAWQLITFICGVLHDIGKMNTIGSIHAHSYEPAADQVGKFKSSASPSYSTVWEPTVQSFESWRKANKVVSYYIDYERRDTYPAEDYTQRYLLALIPRNFLAYIYYSNPVIRQQFEDFIRNPGSAAKTPIFGVVQDADHINVSQAMDPRRKPGSIEISTLIMRRFAEYAAEMSWNLPTSPFLFAHTQVKLGDSFRYYGLPYFVVNKATVSQLETYILSRPTFGVSIDPRRITELIFNALESHQMMFRTIHHLLPIQKPSPDIAECVPASRAKVRFTARQQHAVALPQIQPDDALLELNVIPLRVRVPAHTSLEAPTLSFDGIPQPSGAAVLYAILENGGLEPIDHSLRNDESYRADFKMSDTSIKKVDGKVDFSDLNVPSDALNEIINLPPARVNRSKKPVETDSSKNDAPSAKTIAMQELQTKDPTAPTQGADIPPEPKSDAALASSREAKDPVSSSINGDPVWVSLFRSLTKNDAPDTPSTGWAAVWLYVKQNPHSSVDAVVLQAGYYAFRCSALPLDLRARISADLMLLGIPVKTLSGFWQNEKITLDHPMFPNLFDLAKDHEGRQVFRFKPEVCSAIEEAIGLEGQGGAV
jgi:hypothetical protein